MASRTETKHITLAVVFMCLTLPAPTFAEDTPPSEQVDREFTLDVLPVLKAKCFGCHGEDASDIKGELDLTTREGLLKGGESGDPSLMPGDPDESILLQAIMWEGLEMPPKENDRLNEQQIASVRRWIEHGAAWPNDQTQQEIRKAARSVRETAEGLIVDTSGGTSDEWTLSLIHI